MFLGPYAAEGRSDPEGKGPRPDGCGQCPLDPTSQRIGTTGDPQGIGHRWRRGWDDCCPQTCRTGIRDRKSTRLNSSHGYISYAVFCLKKQKNKKTTTDRLTLPQNGRWQTP